MGLEQSGDPPPGPESHLQKATRTVLPGKATGRSASRPEVPPRLQRPLPETKPQPRPGLRFALLYWWDHGSEEGAATCRRLCVLPRFIPLSRQMVMNYHQFCCLLEMSSPPVFWNQWPERCHGTGKCSGCGETFQTQALFKSDLSHPYHNKCTIWESWEDNREVSHKQEEGLQTPERKDRRHVEQLSKNQWPF